MLMCLNPKHSALASGTLMAGVIAGAANASGAAGVELIQGGFLTAPGGGGRAT